MPLSRDELRKQLQAALAGDGEGSKPSKGAAKPVAPAKTNNPFAKKKRVIEVVEDEEEDEGAVAVADEEDEEEVDEPSDVESSPMDEVIDALVSLVDVVMDHGESIKSYLNNCR